MIDQDVFPKSLPTELPPLNIKVDPTKPYGELRAQILSRPFALGRYFRADHLSFYNSLCVVHEVDGTNQDDTENNLIHRCLWADVLGVVSLEVVQPMTI